LREGWAVNSGDLIGASPYSPVVVPDPPPWVDAGAAMPAGTDAVLPIDGLSAEGGLTEIVASVAPSESVRRAGLNAVAGAVLCGMGDRPRPSDVAVATAAGIDRALIREASVSVLQVPDHASPQAAADLIDLLAGAAGSAVTRTALPASNATTIAAAIAGNQHDVIVVVGGAGLGRHHHAAEALAASGSLIAHGIALRPGDTSGVGVVGRTAVLLVPGSLDGALAAALLLLLPCLDHLTGARPRQPSVTGRLCRKLSSSVGMTEVALMRADEGGLEPLAVGDLTLEAIARATAWLAIPAGSEGVAAGETVTAFLL
jgi:molybdopterin biosynthesis enzyme